MSKQVWGIFWLVVLAGIAGASIQFGYYLISGMCFSIVFFIGKWVGRDE